MISRKSSRNTHDVRKAGPASAESASVVPGGNWLLPAAEGFATGVAAYLEAAGGVHQSGDEEGDEGEGDEHCVVSFLVCDTGMAPESFPQIKKRLMGIAWP